MNSILQQISSVLLRELRVSVLKIHLLKHRDTGARRSTEILVCLLYSTFLMGQNQPYVADTSLQLQEIVVNSQRLQQFGIGNLVKTIDSTALSQNQAQTVADLLEHQGTAFVKSYGLGSLATLTTRGTSASHTALVWNGFTIQSPMNGLFDLSLLPVHFVDNIQLQYGGSSALFGSGAMGGAIHLHNQARFHAPNSLQFYSQVNSFPYHQTGFRWQINAPKYSNSLRFFTKQAKNNFPFINTAAFDAPKVKQTNAAVDQWGLLWDNYWQINPKQQLAVWLWYQTGNRQIPPSMTEGESVAHQQDDMVRLAARWQYLGKKVHWTARSAFFDEQIVFEDQALLLNAFNHAQSWINEVDGKIFLHPQHTLNIGLNHTFHKALADGYPNFPTQQQTALFVAHRWENKRQTWQLASSFRQTLVDQQFIPFTAAIGFNGKLSDRLTLHGKVSKNYRQATFNDLFWQPGGNPDLENESGWQQEIGIQFNQRKNMANTTVQFHFNVETTFYNSHINNQIWWHPEAGVNYWVADNVFAVWSRGMENAFKIGFSQPTQNWSAQFSGSYHFNLATNQKVGALNESALHKQLIYAPKHQGNIQLLAQWRSFSFHYSENFMSKRFTTLDNSLSVGAYAIANMRLAKDWTWGKQKINTYVQINNLWNKNYQVIAWRAMPLRYVQFGVSGWFY